MLQHGAEGLSHVIKSKCLQKMFCLHRMLDMLRIQIYSYGHIYVQGPDAQRDLLQRALQGVNSQDDLSVTPRGGSTPTARENSEGPPRRRNRRSSMGPDLLTGPAPRHRRSSLGPGRMEYSGGVSSEGFSHKRRYRSLAENLVMSLHCMCHRKHLCCVSA